MRRQRFALAGFGDIAVRVARQLLEQGVDEDSLMAIGRNPELKLKSNQLRLASVPLDVDRVLEVPARLDGSKIAYFIPPQKTGSTDLRSAAFTNAMRVSGVTPKHIVLISTTGVYGDTAGQWVTEQSPTKPSSERSVRRLSAEKIWSEWCTSLGIGLAVLRVPGIYSYSRIPKERLERAEPVVRREECGVSNRIHAEDLAQAIVRASLSETNGVFNVSDGAPSTITEYLQAAARVIDLPALPEISLSEAEGVLSERMLSYLKESRKISNTKMLEELKVALLFPDFKEGLRHF